ncbi:MAG: hypothetical protein JXN59_01255, partial [Anaerolineae bacterium]|nr:hypothetical protein [Anaerolineae bacterium]
MSDQARRWFNAIAAVFDRRAIKREQHLSRQEDGSRTPITARQAYERILPEARRFDRRARLTLIVSQQGLDGSGASAHWEFCFDLPHRQATMNAEWILPWDEAADDYGAARIDITLRPFPAEDSLLRQMVQQG